MNIEDFLLDRIIEMEQLARSLPLQLRVPIMQMCDNQRVVIEWHKHWRRTVGPPPTTPLLMKMAMMYCHYPEWNPDWLVMD